MGLCISAVLACEAVTALLSVSYCGKRQICSSSSIIKIIYSPGDREGLFQPIIKNLGSLN